MNFEDAKQEAIERSRAAASRVYIIKIDGEFYTQNRDELDHNGLSMRSPSPVIGFAERGFFHNVPGTNP